MRRTARLKTLARGTDSCRRATHPTDSPAQDKTQLRASEPTPPAHPSLDGPELDSRGMSYASGRPRDVNRCERRRTEQTNDECEWENALAEEIHDCRGLLNCTKCWVLLQ
jgi:hypothetical protein